MWTASTTQIKQGSIIEVTRRFWRMPKGKYDWANGDRIMLEQDERPETCRPGAFGNFYGDCKCGECLTEMETRAMVVDKVTYWADNSIEATVKDEFNNEYQVMLVAPRGDACY